MMDFGATVCKPKNPSCATCPFAQKCVAFEEQTQALLPVKSKKVKAKDRFLYYLLLTCGNKQLVRKRGSGDIWKDLHEFYLVEMDEPADERSLLSNVFWSAQPLFKRGQVKQLSQEFIHQLTHQKIHARILQVNIEKEIVVQGYSWMSNQQIKKLAFPRLITRYLESR
jgi:A/G-specific adenine glycosylase